MVTNALPDIGQDHDKAAVPSVRERTSQRQEQDARQIPEQYGQRERGRFAGLLEDPYGQRETGETGTEHGDQLPDPDDEEGLHILAAGTEFLNPLRLSSFLFLLLWRFKIKLG
jgi:hypothetical protein